MDRLDVCIVASVTGSGRHAYITARTALCQGMEGIFQIYEDLPADLTISHSPQTTKYVAQMHEYLVYGHGASWYEDYMPWSYDSDPFFPSEITQETDFYRLVRQWYS